MKETSFPIQSISCAVSQSFWSWQDSNPSRSCTRLECLSGRVVCGAQFEEVLSETADLLHELLLVCTAHGGFLLEPVHLAL